MELEVVRSAGDAVSTAGSGLGDGLGTALQKFNCPTCDIIVYGEYWDSCKFCNFTVCQECEIREFVIISVNTCDNSYCAKPVCGKTECLKKAYEKIVKYGRTYYDDYEYSDEKDLLNTLKEIDEEENIIKY